MSAPGSIPPGWYPDPWRQAPVRWWDGRAWTGHVFGPAVATGPGLDLHAEEVAARRARWAAWMIAAGQIANMVVFALFARGGRNMYTALRSGASGPADVEGSGLVGAAFAMVLVTSPLALVALGLFLVWFHRAVSNGAALGFPVARDPTLAVVSWFIPILNFWWPYESLRECVPPEAGDTRKRILRWWVWYLVAPVGSMFAAAVAAFSAPAFGVVAVAVVAGAIGVGRETAGVIDGVLDTHRAVAVAGGGVPATT